MLAECLQILVGQRQLILFGCARGQHLSVPTPVPQDCEALLALYELASRLSGPRIFGCRIMNHGPHLSCSLFDGFSLLSLLLSTGRKEGMRRRVDLLTF